MISKAIPSIFEANKHCENDSNILKKQSIQ